MTADTYRAALAALLVCCGLATFTGIGIAHLAVFLVGAAP